MIVKSSSDQKLESKARDVGERDLCSNNEYFFILVNPRDGDSVRKSYTQKVLKIYTKELPAMKYAANTGKESRFLERCVSNGKYCTLVLKSNSLGNCEEVIAAITFQIVPADTQYAEIPLAAVSSIYQLKGIGRILCMELRRRLQSVGIRTIYCWGDKESEGFWFKQGFVSIAKVDTKGYRARKLHIKAGIRRALCFPGGSTLMVSHLMSDILVDSSDTLKLGFSLKPHEKHLSYAVVEFRQSGFSREDSMPNTQNQITSIAEDSEPLGLVRDGVLRGDDKMHVCQSWDCMQGSGSPKHLNSCEEADFRFGVDNVNHCSCCAQDGKRKVWEASLSSLKSKKVKGTHIIDCPSDSNWGLVSGSRREKSVEGRRVNLMSEVLVSKEIESTGECFKVMLMNIADDTKKTHLTKVIEDLGGVVTADGSLSTHVVTGKVRKTLNFCTALCSGAWIVSPSWLKDSFREGRFVDESSYILNDEDYLLKYKDELKGAVLRGKANPRALLKGYNVCIAAHVQPPAETLSAIVRSAGGHIINEIDKVYQPSKTIFVACEEDTEEALSTVKKGIQTFSSEWIMNCIMRQELDVDAPQFAKSL